MSNLKSRRLQKIIEQTLSNLHHYKENRRKRYKYIDEDVLSTVKLIENSQPSKAAKFTKNKTHKKINNPLHNIRLLRGMTLEKLAKLTNLSPSYLSRLESGSRRLNIDIIQNLSKALSCSPKELLPQEEEEETNWSNNFSIPKEKSANDYNLQKSQLQDLPLYNINLTGFGITINFEKPIEWITRPIELAGIVKSFALQIIDNSLSPRYQNGERLLVHPTKPFSDNCTVLVIKKDQKAFIGQFKGWKKSNHSPDQLELSPLGLQQENISVVKDEINSLFRIIGTIEA